MSLARGPLARKRWLRALEISDLWPTQHDRREAFSLELRVGELVSEMFEFEPGLDIYGDGSCVWPQEPMLASAAFALAQRGSDGQLTSISGAIPRWMPQSAGWSERVAAMMAKLFLPVGAVFTARYVGDCLGALTLFEDPCGRDSSWKAPWAGLARAVVSTCGRQEPTKVAWTPAHRSIPTIVCPVERGEAEMNAVVALQVRPRLQRTSHPHLLPCKRTSRRSRPKCSGFVQSSVFWDPGHTG